MSPRDTHATGVAAATLGAAGATGAATLSPPPPVDRPLAAAGWMGIALLCFSALAVAGREAAAELDTFEILGYRSVISLALVMAALAGTGRLGALRARRMPLHLTRNLFHFAGQNLWFHAVAVIPLTQVFAYEFTSPLWIALLAPLMLDERFTRTRLLAAALGFAGILVIARPWAASGAEGFGPGQIAALTAAVCFAFNIMFTKKLSGSETTASIMFFMCVMQALMGFACAAFDGAIAFPWRTWPMVAVIGVCGLGAHYCVARALACAPATIVAPFDFGRLPMIAVVGALLYGEPLEVAVFVGAAMVLTANLMNLRAERRRPA